MTDEATKVRGDLVAGYRLLEVLGKLITVEDFSEDGTGGGVVIAAPHQAPVGTPLSRGHDVHTGTVAERLASALRGKCVVASELRTFVDLNKDPSGARQETSVRHLGRLAFREADRRLKLYYQSQLFSSNPGTVIEIHGHAQGVYDFEVSAGCKLNEDVEQDRVLIAALHTFEATLVRALSKSPAFRGDPPTVGVYPLNSSVKFAATGTHTFNKVEKLRELGVNISGLHIELGKKLRPDPDHPDSQGHYRELNRCLTLAVQAFMKSSEGAVFDIKAKVIEEFSPGGNQVVAAAVGHAFKLRPISKKLIGQRIASLSRRDLSELGLKEGYPVLVAADPEFVTHIELQATTASVQRTGTVGMAKKFRDELGLQLDGSVYLGRRSTATGELTLGYVSDIDDDASQESVEVSPPMADELTRKNGAGAILTLTSSSGKEFGVSVSTNEELPHIRAVALSTLLAGELNVTFGDLVCFSSVGNPNTEPIHQLPTSDKDVE